MSDTKKTESHPLPAVPTFSQDEAFFSDGLEYGLVIACDYLGVSPDEFSWEGATEDFEGDARAVIAGAFAAANPEFQERGETVRELAASRDKLLRALERQARSWDAALDAGIIAERHRAEVKLIILHARATILNAKVAP